MKHLIELTFEKNKLNKNNVNYKLTVLVMFKNFLKRIDRKIVMYYSIDKQQYVKTKVPINMNIIRDAEEIKKIEDDIYNYYLEDSIYDYYFEDDMYDDYLEHDIYNYYC